MAPDDLKRQQIAWWLWALGTVLVVLSWFDIVSPTFGWIGFGVGMVGSVLSWGVRPPSKSWPPAAAEPPKNPETPKAPEQ